MNKFYFFFVICCFLVLSSCKKIQVDNETTSSIDFALVSQEFTQLFTTINISSINQKGLNDSIASASSYVYPGQLDSLSGDTTNDAQGNFTNTGNPPVLWIKFTNCSGYDGKLRNGTIKISFTKQYNQINSTATVTLINYSVNGIIHQGTITITRNTVNSFTYTVANGAYVNNGWSIKYNCNEIITLFDNSTLGNMGDDYLTVLGNGNGTNRENRKFDFSISDAVKKATNCIWISQGVVNLTPDDLHSRTIDFGNGTCDDIASFVVDGQTFTIHMSK